jgi:NitT/TauT family transport system substrate-binding protein
VKLVAAFTLLIGALIAGSPPAPQSGSAPLTHVKIADLPIVVQAPFHIAQDRGYFRDEGLEVAFIPARTTSDAALLLSTGQVDFAGVGPDPALFNAMERGVDLKMLASAAVFTAHSHASGVVVRQDHLDSGDYRDAHDLRGMKIAVSSIQSQFYVEQILAKSGLQAVDVEFTMLAPPDMVPALKNGAIDAAWEIEPLITVMEEQHLATLVASGFEAMPGGIPWLLVAGSTSVGTTPSVDNGITRAVLRGMRDFYHAFNARDADSGGVYDSLAAHSSLSDRTVLEKVGMHTVDPNGTLDTRQLDAYQDYYLHEGSQRVRLDLPHFVDAAPLDAALASLGAL